MEKYFAGNSLRRTARAVSFSLVAIVILLATVAPSVAQKDKKKKTAQPSDNSKLAVPLTDEQQIDYMLSEMLGAWQLGDIEKMHAKYADDVSMVNGSWAPPVIGWTNYLAIYQQQRARMQQISLERSNTYIKVAGNFGWACYQWEFTGLVDGQPAHSFGHTTVVVQKQGDHWVIVHNHTSQVPTTPPASPENTPPSQPTKPNGY
jgi:ketosteroid isomerase-like protein